MQDKHEPVALQELQYSSQGWQVLFIGIELKYFNGHPHYGNYRFSTPVYDPIHSSQLVAFMHFEHYTWHSRKIYVNIEIFFMM